MQTKQEKTTLAPPKIAVPDLEEVLKEKTLPPWDFASFEKFCVNQHTIEVLRFWKTVESWKQTSDEERTVELADQIFKLFLLKDSDFLINLPGKLFKELQAKYERLSSLSTEEMRTLFDEAQFEMYRLMRTGMYHSFVREVVLESHLLFAEEVVKWWNDKELTLAKFVAYPQLINAADARLFAFIVFCLWTGVIISSIVTDSQTVQFAAQIVAISTASSYVLRSLFGPKIDPWSLFVLFIFRPFVENRLGLIKSEFRSDALPRRCAMIIGSVFGCTGTVLLLHSSLDRQYKISGLVVLGFLNLMAFLVCFFDFCLMCYTYGLVMRVQYKINVLEGKYDTVDHPETIVSISGFSQSRIH
jgi:hypothetical protein